MALNTRQTDSTAALAQAWQNLETDPAAARRLAEDLRRSAPANEEATLLLAASLQRGGDVGAARDVLAPLIASHTTSPIAWFEWGMILSQSDDDAGAVAALERCVMLQPGFAAAWRALGDLLMVLGSGVAAGQAYACAARAGTLDPRLAAAAAALAEGRAQMAEAALKAYVQQFPADLRAVYLLAEAAMRVGRAAQAEVLLQHCLRVAPGFAEARHSLAILLCGQGRFALAVPHLKSLLDGVPQQPGLRMLLAVCLTKIGDFAAAIGLYETMLAAAPEWRKIWLKYGDALKAMGREADAARAFRTNIRLAPNTSAAYLSLGDLKTVPFTAAEIDAMRALLAGGSMDAEAAAQLHYVLGHALEQQAAYADAFAHFAHGSALRRAAISYEANAMTAFVGATQAVFTPAFFASRQGAGQPSDAPIFIVGLPRAGSTLVEQILASHHAVEGTAELEEIGVIAGELRGGRPAAELPAIVAGLDRAALAALGARYLARTQQFRRLGRPRFTDKRPDNFLHVGLIHAMLPRARIIDVRRAPMAAGLALFKQYFRPQENGPNYSYDLAEIGRYYRDYAALMAHFATVLPGTVHLVQYEALVTDTEAQVRALLDHCGLDFDPACLRFWETARPVQTPSAQQVRRPIFREALEHWRHYEPWLEPLRAELK